MSLQRFSIAFAVLLSCAPSPPTPASAPAPVAAPTKTAAEAPVASASQGARFKFGASPLTPFAEELASMVVAAVHARPFPPHRAELEDNAEDLTSVVLRPGDPPVPESLTFEAFLAESDIMFPSHRTEAATQPAWTLRVVFFVGAGGVKIAGVRLRGEHTPRELPAWLRGVEEAGWQVIHAARKEQLRRLLVGDVERCALRNDALFAKITEDMPDDALVDRVESMVTWDGPTGFHADDLALVARDDQGRLWGFQLDVDHARGGVVLDSRPFVRVRLLEAPEEGRRE